MTRRWFAISAAVVLAASVGCSLGSESAQNYERESSNLKTLSYFLTQYSAQNQGRRPPDEAALRKFLSEIPREQLAETLPANLEDLMVSERDGQPIVVVYESQQPPVGPESQQIVAYEQTAVDGKRRVSTMLGAVLDVDESEISGSLSAN